MAKYCPSGPTSNSKSVMLNRGASSNWMGLKMGLEALKEASVGWLIMSIMFLFGMIDGLEILPPGR
jgi:hypothetical protein